MIIKDIKVRKCYAKLDKPMNPRGDVGFTVYYHTGSEHQYITIIELETDTKLTGFTILSGDYDTDNLYNLLMDSLNEKNPLQIRHLLNDIYESAKKTNTYNPKTIKRIVNETEVALWDLAGKHFNTPLYKLLGGSSTKNKVQVYAGSASFCFDELKNLIEKAKSLKANGFNSMKLKVGHGFEEDEELVAKIRETVGEDVELYADANQAYDFNSAKEFCSVLAKYNVLWFEEPIEYTDPSQYAKLKNLNKVEITGGEIFKDIPEVVKSLENNMFDIMQCDAINFGVSKLLSIGEICSAYGVKSTGHCVNNAVRQALSMHLDLVLPNSASQEFETFNNPLFKSIFKEPFYIEDGYCILPDKPGLGYELNEETIQKYLIK